MAISAQPHNNDTPSAREGAAGRASSAMAIVLNVVEYMAGTKVRFKQTVSLQPAGVAKIGVPRRTSHRACRPVCSACPKERR